MSSYLTQSDHQLIELLKKGDRGAFEEVYNRYQSLLFLYALKKLRDEEEAKDVVQEVFVSLWKLELNLNVQGSVAGYLYRAVLNKILNIFRHKNITQEYISSFQASLDDEAAVSADYLIREKDISSLIELEISLLPDRMREVFELRQKAYLSNKEIALQLNISEHTVATQMKKALKILRKKLGTAVYFSYFFHL